MGEFVLLEGVEEADEDEEQGKIETCVQILRIASDGVVAISISQTYLPMVDNVHHQVHSSEDAQVMLNVVMVSYVLCMNDAQITN